MLKRSNKLQIKELLEAGAHFGHQTHRWNPKMKPYVFGERNGIYVIDLTKTVLLAEKAYEFLKKVAAEGRPILFVGTKRQAAKVVKGAAESCGAFYVTHRWMGGMLTNYKTITLSVDKLRKVEKMKETGDFALLTKKERSKIEKEVAKLERNLGGIKDMRKLPGAVFVVDPNAEKIAVNEAKNLGIPVVAITDTNCDPENVDFVVPGNDDAIKSIMIFTEYFAKSIAEGMVKKPSKKVFLKEKGNDPDGILEKEVLSKFENDIDLKMEGDEATE
ncbi:MAG: 30S ribosomal protein S2 [Halobacteriovoraceae bacterium]|nr:30S ribosomal protein S2 [Halobacteriovoraceae bacterium]